VGAFRTGASELALNSSASLLGQKGGRAKARNRAARLAAASPANRGERGRCGVAGCRNPLCENPNYPHVTIPMIAEFKTHEQISAAAQPTAEPNADPAEQPERGN
jgi:hypothetical protein